MVRKSENEGDKNRALLYTAGAIHFFLSKYLSTLVPNLGSSIFLDPLDSWLGGMGEIPSLLGVREVVDCIASFSVRGMITCLWYEGHMTCSMYSFVRFK